jgi:hypothetical protein
MRYGGGTVTLALSMCVSGTGVWGQPDPEAFWQRGRVRELYISRLPADDQALAAWAADGVNCVTGVQPELAHQHGLKTRTWFTMNFMDSRRMDEETIKSMCAINEDGSYRRPNDPLFPTVGQYGWSACVNNPNWIEHARSAFTGMAEAEWDGCHIDFASHYEPCFCEHCRDRWQAWAQEHDLDGVDLSAASHAEDLRTRMLLREFRIRCVMDFLGGVRQTARRIRPGFATDGTWHQDSGSTYQWAYGDHFDLMCIEGTTHGPFPPAGTQIPWLMVAHALSERSERAPVAMSVTYHLLPDEEGRIHHGRMAADRLRVALGEIVSQGAVSWLGLGGPGTGNLLEEHQDIVRAYYRHAAKIEPLVAGAEELAEVGIIFSPRSFLVAGGVREQLYAIGHALMAAHVSFKVLSDVGLSAARLEGLSGVVLLSAPALSDAGCEALEGYVGAGGKLLVIGDDAATLTEDWRERTPRPLVATPAKAEGGMVRRAHGAGECWYWVEDVFAGKQLGATQRVTLDQAEPVRLAVEGWSKAEGVSGARDAGYSLYVDLTHQDGTPLWGQTATFNTGTHDWEFSRTIIESDRPFRSAGVHMLFRYHRGTVWFRDVRFGLWDEEKQEIVQNLLGSAFRASDGQTYSVAPEGEETGEWVPYRDGFEVENMLDMGLWAKMANIRGLGIGQMHEPDAASIATVMEAVAPLRPDKPMLTVSGAGADRVFAQLARTADRLVIQLINYAAELHPDLPELEQQKADQSTPATDLVLRVAVPDGMRIDAAELETYFPEQEPKVDCETADGEVVVHIDRLQQYGVVAIGVD